jgi:hypothetical protein
MDGTAVSPRLSLAEFPTSPAKRSKPLKLGLYPSQNPADAPRRQEWAVPFDFSGAEL